MSDSSEENEKGKKEKEHKETEQEGRKLFIYLLLMSEPELSF